MDHKEDFFLPEEVAEWIGMKKSEYLSNLIQEASPDDFGFEEYHRFNDQIPKTIAEPDRAYQYVEDQYPMRMFARSYGEPVFYQQVVLGVVLPEKDSAEEVFIPVLVFITKKSELVDLFSKGELVKRPTLN